MPCGLFFFVLPCFSCPGAPVPAGLERAGLRLGCAGLLAPSFQLARELLGFSSILGVGFAPLHVLSEPEDIVAPSLSAGGQVPSQHSCVAPAVFATIPRRLAGYLLGLGRPLGQFSRQCFFPQQAPCSGRCAAFSPRPRWPRVSSLLCPSGRPDSHACVGPHSVSCLLPPSQTTQNGRVVFDPATLYPAGLSFLSCVVWLWAGLWLARVQRPVADGRLSLGVAVRLLMYVLGGSYVFWSWFLCVGLGPCPGPVLFLPFLSEMRSGAPRQRIR